MALSKPFAIATEGPTIDGRNISREWIQQMAASYDQKVYTAQGNLEHLLFLNPDTMFSVHGKVVSLSTRETELMGEKKLQLMAVVDASDSIIAMQKAGKKLFSSIEVAANFLGKGFAYLTGLAFTDTPASIGTEPMKFSANKDSVYSFSQELEIEFEKEEAQPSAGESLFNKVKTLLTGKSKNDEARFTDIGQAVETVATSQKELLEKFSATDGALKAANDKITELTTAAEKDRAAFAAFKEKVDAMPDGTGHRPAASGGSGAAKTDC